MKLFVVTDIHGSAFWAEQAVRKFQSSHADKLVLLGDVYNHGPRNPFPRDYAPMRVAQLLNGIADKVFSVIGNCDSEVDAMISDFPFVRDSVIPLGKRRLYLTHGHVYNKNNLPKLAAGDVLMYGHFHVNEYVCQKGVHCINVSSASLPKDCSAFCIVDERGASVFDFDDNLLLKVVFDS